jgi:hypothetical protein
LNYGHQLTRMFTISPANVSVCVFPSQLLPSIYRYGYAMPFYNVQQTVRAIVFGTRDQSASSRTRQLSNPLTVSACTVALNFGVQIGWIFVSWCTMTGFQYFKRRQAIRAHTLAEARQSMLSDKV